MILFVVLTTLAPVLWSTGGLGLRLVEASPWAMMFWRSLFMSGTVLIGTAVTMRRRFLPELRRATINGFWIGICLALALILYILSITATTVADSLLVQATGPLFIVVLGWVVLREPVRPVTVVALIAVSAGISFILIPSIQRGGFSGNLIGIAKAVAFAAATVMIRRKRSVDLLPAIGLGAVISTIVAGIAAPSLAVSGRDLLILAYLGVFQTGIAFMLHASFSGKLPASQTGLIVLLEAVLGPLWVWVFLSEAPAPLTFVGGAIIIAALVVHTLVYSRKPPPEATTGAGAAPVTASDPAPGATAAARASDAGEGVGAAPKDDDGDVDSVSTSI